MCETEKDEVLVCFKEGKNTFLFGRLWPFDKEDWCNETIAMFQVEYDGNIEDYSDYQTALSVFEIALSEESSDD